MKHNYNVFLVLYHKKLAMIFSHVNRIPAFLLEKLDILFKLLKERKLEFEAFACRVRNKELRRTILTLAQETNQYANELLGQIETMGGEVKPPYETFCISDNNMMMEDENDILCSCQVSEKKLIVAYRTILNEPFLHDNLRRLIRYQLNGLTYAFMQLKLLNTSIHR